MRLRLLLLAPLFAALFAAPAPAQDLTPAQRQDAVRAMRDALVRDPSILRDALAALQADDARRQEESAKDMLARVGPRLVTPADPVEGNPLGDVTVVEFYDTRCPYCRRMPPVLAELLQQDKRLRLVMKDLPILGPSSQLESRALLAAQKQGGYFKLQDAIMASTGTASRDSLRDLADRVGLDGGRLLRDLDDPAIKARLQANLDLAHEMGIDGTPAFVVGRQMISGAAELAELQAAVAAARLARN